MQGKQSRFAPVSFALLLIIIIPLVVYLSFLILVMSIYLKGILYRILIDPLLLPVRKEIINIVGTTDRIIDIACGTGTLALRLAGKASYVRGIDIDERLISYAIQRIEGNDLKNICFDLCDASDISECVNMEFDVAVTSMAVHQFDQELAVRVLIEMKRVAKKVVIADYNYPLPDGFFGSIAWGIEKMAAGDHYRNFRNYMANCGIKYFTSKAGMKIEHLEIRGQGIFVIIVCS